MPVHYVISTPLELTLLGPVTRVHMIVDVHSCYTCSEKVCQYVLNDIFPEELVATPRIAIVPLTVYAMTFRLPRQHVFLTMHPFRIQL